MTNILNISTHPLDSNSKILIDTNIWICCFFTFGKDDAARVKLYSSFLKRALEAKAKLYICSHVLSEFINRFLKNAHKASANSSDSYKTWRKSKEGQETIEEVKILLKNKIFPNVVCIGDQFDCVGLDGAMQKMNAADYNDIIIFHASKKVGAIVATDDSDFKLVIENDSLMTGNTKLLRASST